MIDTEAKRWQTILREQEISATSAHYAVDREKPLVGALARGISILACFSPSRPELSLSELQESTALPKRTLLRLIETLCDLTLLRFSERVSKYAIGTGTLNLAAPFLARMSARCLVQPLMKEFADHIQGAVGFLVAYAGVVTCVENVPGAGSSIYLPEIGTRVSVSRSAAGRAYLCSIAQADRQAYLADLAARDRQRSAWLSERLAEAQDELAEHGFCRGHRDLHREIETIAVPMQKGRGGDLPIFVASLGVFNPLSKRLREDVGPRLVMLVRNVEAAIGSIG